MSDEFQSVWSYPHYEQAAYHQRRSYHPRAHTGILRQGKVLGSYNWHKLIWGSSYQCHDKKSEQRCNFPYLSSCPRQIRATCLNRYKKTHINALEAGQRRATRFITWNCQQESCVTTCLHKLQLERLQESRLGARAIMMFRAV